MFLATNVLIVITHPQYIENEVEQLSLLFKSNLQTLHLRKPNWKKADYEALLKSIAPAHKKKLMLHQYHELALKYNVKGLHLKEEHRHKLSMSEIKALKKDLMKKSMLLSSSFHATEEIKPYDGLFDFVFFSPVFESISKPGYLPSSEFRLQSSELKATKVIALGGIQESNISLTKEMGFDGGAMLGAIWQDPHQALSRFEAIKKAYETAFHTFI